jgi:hypothetical protein
MKERKEKGGRERWIDSFILADP